MNKIMGGFSILVVLSVLTACNISGWSTYTNTTYNFELQYPPGGSIASGAHDTFAYIDLPFPSGTNLSEKYMDINVQDGAPTCESPWAVGLAPLYLTTANITIHGMQWLQQTFSNHGASNFVDFSAYSTVSGSVCVSLTFNLRSSNPQVYATPIPTFSPNESLVFPLIVATFQWLNGGATTPTRRAQFVIRSTPTLVTTLTPSEMPASVFTPLPSDTPTSSALIFTPMVSPLIFNYYYQTKVLACIVKNPQVDISVAVSDPAVVHGMVLFFHLKNKADGAETPWNTGVNMNPQGNGMFDRSLSANQIPNLSAISTGRASAWLEYQFAATDALGGTIGRSPVYSNVSLTPCQG